VQHWHVILFSLEWRGDAAGIAFTQRYLSFHEEQLERWKAELALAMLGGKQGD